jgi:hypothetical protein
MESVQRLWWLNGAFGIAGARRALNASGKEYAYMTNQQNQPKQPSELTVITKAKDLIKHTYTLTENTERFPKKYRFTLVNRLQERATDIYECLLEANELDLRDPEEAKERQKLQARALTYCKELLFFLELSFELNRINAKSLEYWSKLAFDVMYMTKAWKRRDKSR